MSIIEGIIIIVVAAFIGFISKKAYNHFKSKPQKADNLPKRNKYFVGRKSELRKIRVSLKKAPLIVITGESGLGKSQLSIEYAYRHYSEYKHIWLVNAASSQQLIEGYKAFARRIGLSWGNENDPGVVLSHAKNWFDENRKFLFIFDNAEGTGSIQDFLPSELNNGHVIVNTRNIE